MTGQAVFIKVDVNRNSVTSREMGIRSMPTFQFYSDGKLRHQFSGADGSQLDRVSHALGDEAAKKGTYVNEEVTPSALSAYYSKHDPEKAGEAAVAEILAKYDGKTAKLARSLSKKYVESRDHI